MINKYPLILGEEREVLKARLMYLSGRQFTTPQIINIVGKFPRWLCHSIDEIDARLGTTQNFFELSGELLYIVNFTYASHLISLSYFVQGWSR